MGQSRFIFHNTNILCLNSIQQKKLGQCAYSDNHIYKGRKVLPVYLILTLMFLMILLVRHGIKHGTINIYSISVKCQAHYLQKL